MSATLVQHKSGTSSSATTTAAFDATPTSGNRIVLGFASDDYNATPDAGWSQESQMEQQTFHGLYAWHRAAAGGNSFPYTIGTATHSAWVLAEISGLDSSPYDVSLGQFVQTAASTYNTPSLTPTGGDRVLIALIGGSRGSAATPGIPGSWTNSFTNVDGAQSSGAGTNDGVGMASLIVTADGSTSYSTTATYAGGTNTPNARTGLIIAFKVAAAGGGPTPVVRGQAVGQAVKRAATWCKRSPRGILVPDLWLPNPKAV